MGQYNTNWGKPYPTEDCDTSDNDNGTLLRRSVQTAVTQRVQRDNTEVQPFTFEPLNDAHALIESNNLAPERTIAALNEYENHGRKSAREEEEKRLEKMLQKDERDHCKIMWLVFCVMVVIVALVVGFFFYMQLVSQYLEHLST